MEEQRQQPSLPITGMKLKVCGMREPENIRQAAMLNPDYLGFIFYPASKRYAGSTDSLAIHQLPSSIKKTGVFVNSSATEIAEKIREYKLDAVQLHGSESPEFCSQIKALGVEVIKAFGIDEEFDFSIPEAYTEVADFFLFDTKSPQHGGTGRTFNWDILASYHTEKPFFLSGGLGPENAAAATAISHPFLYALDLNSRFEVQPGLKDISKLKIFFEQLKNYSADADQEEL